MDINIINMRFKYSDMDTISDVEYLNSYTNRSPLNEFGLRYSQKIFVPFAPLVLLCPCSVASRYTKYYGSKEEFASETRETITSFYNTLIMK
jgi:hypothetical protein